MSDRRAKLEALAAKRKNVDSESSDEEVVAPKRSKTVSQVAKGTPRAPREEKYTKKDGFVVASDDDEEDQDEDESEEEPEASSDEEPKKKPKKKASSSSAAPKKKKSSKPKGSDDEDFGGSDNDDKDDISEDELEGLDTSVIISGGRRTRGRKIDYKQFGADPEDEDE